MDRFVPSRSSRELLEHIEFLLLGLITRVENLEGAIMPQFEEISALIDAINESSNKNAAALVEIESDLKKLREDIVPGVLTAEQAEVIKSRLSAASDKLAEQADQLNVLGQDPEEPVPPTE